MSKLGNAAKGVGEQAQGHRRPDHEVPRPRRQGSEEGRRRGCQRRQAEREGGGGRSSRRASRRSCGRASGGLQQWLAGQAKGAVHGDRARRPRARQQAGQDQGSARPSSAPAKSSRRSTGKSKAKLAEWRDKFKKWREDRKKNKPTPEQRLEAAVERIRPKVALMLNVGVPNLILRAALAAMRVWYRLSSLNITGEETFDVTATVNPGATVIGGVTVEKDRLVAFIRRLSRQLQAKIAANPRIPPIHTSRRQLRGQEVRVHTVQPETPTPRVSTFLERQRADQYRKTRVVEYLQEQPNEPPDTVEIWQNTPGKNRSIGGRNRMVRVQDPLTGKKYDRMAYPELLDLMGNFNKNAQRRISKDALQVLAGGTPSGPHRGFTRQLAQWVQIQEEQRGRPPELPRQ